MCLFIVFNSFFRRSAGYSMNIHKPCQRLKNNYDAEILCEIALLNSSNIAYYPFKDKTIKIRIVWCRIYGTVWSILQCPLIPLITMWGNIHCKEMGKFSHLPHYSIRSVSTISNWFCQRKIYQACGCTGVTTLSCIAESCMFKSQSKYY